MQFSSIAYLGFVAVAVIGYFALPGVRSRTIWLLVASYGFYYSLSAGWTAVLLFVTALGYAFGLLIDRAGPAQPGEPISPKVKRLMTSGIVIVVLTLCVFKYSALVSATVRRLATVLAMEGSPQLIALLLPIGISFWTFQTIAYLVDVSKGTLEVERDPLRYALFIAFFPQVAAGPIPRGGQLLPQLAERHTFQYDQMRSGLLLMLWGFFKKLVVADALAVVVNTAFATPRAYGDKPLVLAAAVLAFAVQLYCDFSGYTDLARGSARLFGVDLVRNFNRPYAARSIKEFWRRWHMSLMNWLRDYVYIPLGGSRVSKWRRYVNILAVFLLSGVWHGVGLHFIVWGLLNAVYQICGELVAPWRDAAARLLRIRPDGRVRHTIQTATTFALVCIAWTFFRAGTVREALYILGTIFHILPSVATQPTIEHTGMLGLIKPQLFVAIAGAVVVFGLEWLSERVDLPGLLYSRPIVVRWLVYQVSILVVVVFGYYGSIYAASSFAYFKF
ncbi:MAG: MBOAT family O-acyltransferase [Actinomycetes bacterium]